MPIWKAWNPPRMTITTATFYWGAPYAYYVHEGHTTRSGTTVPPNRWTDRGLAGSNLPSVFAKSYKTTLDAAFVATCTFLNQRFLEEVPVRTGAKNSGELKDSQTLTFS